MKTKKILKIALSICVCFLVFTLFAYFYLDASLKKHANTASAEKSGVPYYQIPDNSGVLFIMPDNRGALLYLDFKQSKSTLIYIEECDRQGAIYNGFPIDYLIETDYYMLSGIIDNIGGIELDIDGEYRRYTGIGAQELLSESDSFRKDLRTVIKGIFAAIEKNGFTLNDIKYILEDSYYSTLTIPDCLNWDEYLKELLSNITIIG